MNKKTREIIDTYKLYPTTIIDQLVWCDYLDSKGHKLENNIAFIALKEHIMGHRNDFTPNDYQAAALTTANKYLTPIGMLENAALGICGEGGEVADLVKKTLFQGHKLDKQKMIKELGDVC